MKLTHLSDDALLHGLGTLCMQSRQMLVGVLRHLVEIERRGLFARVSCSSMFVFCTTRLGMSEGEADRRIVAARLSVRFPWLLERIAKGEVHLSGLRILAQCQDDQDFEALVLEACGKSKLEMRMMVARRRPRPDAPCTFVPVPAVTAPSTLDPSALPFAGVALAGEEPARAKMAPLSEGRLAMTLTIAAELREKLDRATALMSHRNPSRKTENVLDAALDLLLAKLEKERLGKADRPRSSAPGPTKGTISRAMRRAVFERDGERCTWVDAEGRRCACTEMLEIDHVHPAALGGAAELGGLRVLCRVHNRLYAEQCFGKEHVAKQIHLRQHKCGGAEAEPVRGAASRCAATAAPVTVATEHLRGSTCGAPEESAIPREAVEQAMRGLLNMGFAKKNVDRALVAILSRHPGETARVPVGDLLREGIAALSR